MLKLERKLLEWVDRQLNVIRIVVVCVRGLAIRWPMRDLVRGDSYYFLLPWYDRIKENGLSQQVGDYNLLYQALIALLTYLPLKPLYAYKLLSVVFDYALATGAAFLTASVTKEDRQWKGAIVFGLVLLSPLVVLNSAAWAQCDGIYTCFAVFSLLALYKERHILAMVLLGLSFTFKLQAVFLLPLFLFVYYSRRKFSLLLFFVVPLTMCAASLPSVFFGRSLVDVFLIYFRQTGSYPYMAMNYPSPWLLLANGMSSSVYGLLRLPAMGFTVAALAVLMLYWLRKRILPEGENLLIMAFLLCFTCVLFLPSMHERYGFIYEILAIILAVLIPKTAPLCIGLIAVTVCTYGSFLFNWQSVPLKTLAVLNLVIYVAYVFMLSRRMRPAITEETE